MRGNTNIVGTEVDFVKNSVEYLRNIISNALSRSDQSKCIIGLSGGSTPGPIYQMLAEQYKDKLDWSRVTLFLIDDRYVPPDHKDSNQKIVNECFAPVVNKLGGLVMPRSGSVTDWKKCTEDYNEQLKALVGRVDVMVFGLGNDGHFASLFPPVVEEAFIDDGKTFAVATTTEEFAVRERISVNYAFLKSQKDCAKNVFFLKGQDKRKVWDEMVQAMPKDRSELSHDTVKRWPAIELLFSDKTDVFVMDPQKQ